MTLATAPSLPYLRRMDVALIPCPRCKRHVRRDEDACPFCAAVVPADVAAVPGAPARLGRAAVFLFATTVVGGLSTQACKGSGAQKPADPAAGTGAAIVASYGGPPSPGPAESCPPAASGSGSSM